jgi:tRNA (adenine57-N1/adenine58-N1)-methyltransferase
MTAMTNSIAQEGDIALLVSAQQKRHIVRLQNGDSLQTHRGIVPHSDLIGQVYGTRVHSHLGSAYLLLQPSLAEIMLEIKRNTQIMYPKDVGYILLSMDIGPGKRVLEAGSGSGSLTTALAFMVGDTGHVYSYDYRIQMQNLAAKNLEKVGLRHRVTFKERDISMGFDETEVDAVYLDVPNPYDYLPMVRKALKSGGFFGSIQPTTNQVSHLIAALKRENFGFIDVCEVLQRFYKIASDRLRPADRMIAHTGFLIFARSIIDKEDETPVPEEDPETPIIID